VTPGARKAIWRYRRDNRPVTPQSDVHPYGHRAPEQADDIYELPVSIHRRNAFELRKIATNFKRAK